MSDHPIPAEATSSLGGSAGPVLPQERIATIDILRGFALLGILLVNFPGSEAARSGSADDTIRRILDLLVSGKFYTTFSFLFGLGFAIQLVRSRARGTRIFPIYLRRMAVLLLIGLAHAILIWNGDILLLYATMGFLLTFFYRLAPKLLLACALLSMVSSYFMFGPDPLRTSDLIPTQTNPEVEQRAALEQQAHDGQTGESWMRQEYVYRWGTYSESVVGRLQQLKLEMEFVSRYFFGTVFAMFLLGLYAGRHRIFNETAAHLSLIRKTMWIALPIWLLTNITTVYGRDLWPALADLIPEWGRRILLIVQGPAGSLFYISSILLLLTTWPKWCLRLAPLGWVGRMPLSNYLMQSLIGTTLYYGYGFGLHNKIGYLTGLLIGVIIFACQVPLSRWWLKRFQFGPCEWLWRSLTYGKMQPLLIHGLSPAPV